jgi:hypothetical protein
LDKDRRAAAAARQIETFRNQTALTPRKFKSSAFAPFKM